MSDYTPTTEEIREYVEIGGELNPWNPPNPEQDSKRAATFDRWLDEVKREAAAEALEAVAAKFREPRVIWHGGEGVQVMTDERHLTMVPLTTWLESRAAEYREADQNEPYTDNGWRRKGRAPKLNESFLAATEPAGQNGGK